MRGSSTPVEEQAFILRNSNSVGLVAQNSASLEKLLKHMRGVHIDGTARTSGISNEPVRLTGGGTSHPPLPDEICVQGDSTYYFHSFSTLLVTYTGAPLRLSQWQDFLQGTIAVLTRGLCRQRYDCLCHCPRVRSLALGRMCM